jgi:predicted  nucleic acid-binding Zn-ribbon protein
MDKDKRISDLRKKNTELEKFKFVLEYKIVELRKQIEPKEKDIETLKSQIEVGVIITRKARILTNKYNRK